MNEVDLEQSYPTFADPKEKARAFATLMVSGIHGIIRSRGSIFLAMSKQEHHGRSHPFQIRGVDLGRDGLKIRFHIGIDNLDWDVTFRIQVGSLCHLHPMDPDSPLIVSVLHPELKSGDTSSDRIARSAAESLIMYFANYVWREVPPCEYLVRGFSTGSDEPLCPEVS